MQKVQQAKCTRGKLSKKEKLGKVRSGCGHSGRLHGGSGIWAQPQRMEIESRLGRRDSVTKGRVRECTQGEVNYST